MRYYIPHVKGRGQEAGELKRAPEKEARRWVVEVAHSCFNRLRKRLVRYEKLDRSFLALNHLAESMMAFRKIKLESFKAFRLALKRIPTAHHFGTIQWELQERGRDHDRYVAKGFMAVPHR